MIILNQNKDAVLNLRNIECIDYQPECNSYITRVNY